MKQFIYKNKIIIVLAIGIIACVSILINLGRVGSNQVSKTVPILEPVIISISKDGFMPATIQIKKGQPVIWKNDDSSLHRVASDPYPTNDALKELDSIEPISQNGAFTFIFEKTGTFTYHDQLNPFKLKGTVIVKE